VNRKTRKRRTNVYGPTNQRTNHQFISEETMGTTFSPRKGQWVLVNPAGCEFTTGLLAADAQYRFDRAVAGLDRDLAKEAIDQTRYDEQVAKARARFDEESKLPAQPLDLTNAHKTVNGLLVGIFQPGGTDAIGFRIPDHVALCKPSGENLRTPDGTLIALKPAALNLSPLLDKADLPPGRKVSDDWNPQA
jgi:hypothetical protein